MTILDKYLKEGVLDSWDTTSRINCARTDTKKECYFSIRYWLPEGQFYAYFETSQLSNSLDHQKFDILIYKDQYPATWAVCKEHVCSKSPAPPFAFLDLLLDALDQDNQGRLRGWLGKEILK